MGDSPSERVEDQRSFPSGRPDWMFGVVFPALALVIELSMGWCSDLFFDPLPNWTSVIGVAAVPVLWGMWLARERRGEPSGTVHRLLLFAVFGFAASYVLTLHDLLLPGVLMLGFLGFGLIPLSPLGLLVVSLLRCRHWLRPVSGVALSRRAALAALAVGFGVGIAPFAFDSFVVFALNRAASGDSEKVQSGLRMLNVVGPENVAEVCERRGSPLLRPSDSQLNAQTFFRAFGTPIQEVLEAVETPQGRSLFGPDGERWDAHLGDTQVGPRRKHLRLSDNRMDVRLDVDSGTAQVEWEFTFENNAPRREEEARMLLHVPGAGAATRLTLWVAGEPQEAAFGPRSQVREAYEQVAVRQRRDPALITTRGPDRLLLQCFPILAANYLKVRVGLTIPFEPDGSGGSLLRLPVVEAANFKVDQGAVVPLWIEGGEVLVIEDGSSTPSGKVPASLAWSELRQGAVALVLPGNVSKEGRLSGDEREPGVVVRETTRTIPAPDHWVLVVDGSAPAGKRVQELANALEASPARFSMWWAAESDEHLAGATGTEAAAWLRARKSLGGQDPADVLAKAWDEAAALGAPLVWLHGSLPLSWKPTGALRQRLDRRPDAVALHLVSIAPGENLLLAEFDTFAGTIDSWNALSAGALLRVMGQIGSERNVRDWVREEHPADTAAGVLKRAEPAVRVWLAERLARERSAKARAELVALATRLGVVTAYTGAVVLERAADYERHQLEQQNPLTVPQVPEPAHIALAAGAAVLGIVLIHRIAVRRRAG